MARARTLPAALALVFALVGAGCTAEPEPGPAKLDVPLHSSIVELSGWLPGLGRIDWALWQMKSSNDDLPDRSIPGPTDFFLHALLRLPPGTAATLTAGLPLEPTAPPAGTGHLAVPAGITEALPPGAHWVTGPELRKRLVPAADADRITLCLDLASDTVYLSEVNPSWPDQAPPSATSATPSPG
ncbi:hypothetical protein [Kitasatospora sp. NPDC002040]|uniref:hypothetical protein n=1 Tax=Kitasatospora sp. NPDC002040 TaxID=3154661 RepID=UPI003325E154